MYSIACRPTDISAAARRDLTGPCSGVVACRLAKVVASSTDTSRARTSILLPTRSLTVCGVDE